MDLLRIPASLRCSIFSRLCSISSTVRPISTQTYNPTNIDPILDVEPHPTVPTVNPSTLNLYNTSTPPNIPQLKHAHHFFHSSPPHLLYSAGNFRSLPPSAIPEVAFLGRSNVGKSSLLNALFGRSRLKDAHVSKRPGRTRTMNGFGVTGPGLKLGAASASGEQKSAIWRRFPRGGLVVVDMPGYGGGSRQIWGQEVMKYLENRKQLRRTFVLIDAEHGIKKTDLELLIHLRRKGISHQIVLSKIDKMLFTGSKAPGQLRLHNKLLTLRNLCESMVSKLDEEAGDRRMGGMDVLCCSAEKSLGSRHHKLGVDEIRWSVLSACGLECDESGQRRQYRLSDITILDEEDDVDMKLQ